MSHLDHYLGPRQRDLLDSLRDGAIRSTRWLAEDIGSTRSETLLSLRHMLARRLVSVEESTVPQWQITPEGLLLLTTPDAQRLAPAAQEVLSLLCPTRGQSATELAERTGRDRKHVSRCLRRFVRDRLAKKQRGVPGHRPALYRRAS